MCNKDVRTYLREATALKVPMLSRKNPRSLAQQKFDAKKKSAAGHNDDDGAVTMNLHLALALLAIVSTAVQAGNACTALGSNPSNYVLCLVTAGCAWFSLNNPKTGKPLGCQTLDYCSFTTFTLCASNGAWCIWDAQKKKCGRKNGETWAPTRLPTVATFKPTHSPESGCPSNPSKATCNANVGCRWFAGKTCVGKACTSFSYGCHASTFCDFGTAAQCGLYSECAWTGQMCVAAAPTPAPTTYTPTSIGVCEAASESVDTCTAASPQCYWYNVKDCAQSGKGCKLRSLGCHNATTFCSFSAPTFKYPSNACKLFAPQCAWVPSAGCIHVLPTVAPTKYPTLPPSTGVPSKSPTLHPTTTSPTLKPTTTEPSKSPSHTPSHRPTVSPTRPTTRTPSLSPTKSPTMHVCTFWTTQATCEAHAGSSGRCEWVTETACNALGQECVKYTYGCQPRGFCGVTGKYVPAQCEARQQSDGCVLNTQGDCVSLCGPSRPPPAVTKRSPLACANLVLGGPNAASGFTRFVSTTPNDNAGWAVAGGGDFNGDGKPDFAIGVPGAYPKEDQTRPGTGRVQLVTAYTASNSKDVQLTNALANSVSFNGSELEGLFGDSLAFCDLDNDGLDDLVVAADAATVDNDSFQAGQVYIIWGRTDLVTAARSGAYANLSTASNTYVSWIPGPQELGNFGSDVACAGDVDGDGRADLVVGSRNADPPAGARSRAGSAHIIYGAPRSSFASWSWANQAKYSVVYGRNGQDSFGTAVAGNVDFDGDGLMDIVVGAPWAQGPTKSGAGEAYVIYGRVRFGLLDLLVQPSGVVRYARITGADVVWGNFGQSVGAVGDYNADGLGDFAVGAPMQANKSAGNAYVFLGSASFPATSAVARLQSRSGLGFVFEGLNPGDQTGFAVSKTPLDFNGAFNFCAARRARRAGGRGLTTQHRRWLRRLAGRVAHSRPL